MTPEPDDELWSAIADPSRRRVLDLLVSDVEASASWLAGQVPFSRQAVSKHLTVLEGAGLVSRRKQGREVLYQVDAGRLDQATRAMADVASRWERRLAGSNGSPRRRTRPQRKANFWHAHPWEEGAS